MAPTNSFIATTRESRSHTCVRGVSTDRTLWIARHVLPHEPALRACLARWQLPAGLEADDIVQDVYGQIAAMESIEAIRNPRTYMLGIARTTLLMHVRRSRVVSIRNAEDIDQFAIPSDDPSPEQHVSDRQQLHLLALAVARLPEPGRTAFLLRVTDELPHREIGKRLGMSENAVQKSVAKTLGRLMTMFGRGGNDADRASSPGEGENDERHDHA